MNYTHLTIEEREKLYLLFNQGVSIRKIAAALNRSPSTISRELERNTLFWQPYSPSVAQTRYKNRRKRCGKKRILANAETKEKVRELIQDRHWSPEQVEYRLKLENSPIHISYATIYRAISSGLFDIKKKYLMTRINKCLLQNMHGQRQNHRLNLMQQEFLEHIWGKL